jgi:hypothetical protein
MANSIFPTGPDTDAILGLVTNNADGTLPFSINSSMTTIAVVVGTGKNAYQANDVLTIDGEEILVGSVSGTYPNLILNGCTRGYNGTAATGHALNARVACFISASFFSSLASAIKAIQNYLLNLAFVVNHGAILNGGLTTDFLHVTGNAGADGTLFGAGLNISGTAAILGGGQWQNGLTVFGGQTVSSGDLTISLGNIKILAGSVTDLELKTIGANPAGYVWAVIDQAYRVALGVKSDGSVIAPSITSKLLPAGVSVSGSNVAFPGWIADSEIHWISSPFILFAICDALYRAVFVVYTDGSVFIAGVSAAASSSSQSTVQAASLNGTANPLAPNVDSTVVYSRTDGASHTQIYKNENGVETQLTTDAVGNVAPHFNSDKSVIIWVKNNAPYRMNRFGRNQLPAANDPNTIATLFHILISGQSLATGVGSGGALSTTQPFSNLMFDAGALTCQNSASPVATPTSLLPLVESSAVTGETIASAMANTLLQWAAEAGLKMPFLMSNWGVGGQGIAALRKTTQPYANGQTLVSAGQSLATAAGFAAAVKALCWVHGEFDGTSLTYQADLTTLQSNFELDSMALTGQATEIPMFACQTSGLCAYGTFTPATARSPYALLAAAQAVPGLINLVCPKYWGTYNSHDPHMLAQSYRRLGGYYAKAYLKRVIQQQIWRPLSPRAAVRDGANIYIDFWTPVAPIVIDKSLGEPAFAAGSMAGFEYFDAGTPPAITSVAVIGPTTLQIVLASTPTGSSKAIRYAYSFPGASTTPGPFTGPRGCLRDSDPSVSYYGDKLPNWCVHFNLSIN